MSEHEANAILEPAATRVRDPQSGRSVWLSQMIMDGRIDGDTLRFTLVCSAEHTAEERERIREALLRNIERVGWKGEVACQLITTRPQAAAPKPKAQIKAPPASPPAHTHRHGHSHDHGRQQGRQQGKDPVRGMSGPGMGPHGGPIQKQPIDGVANIIAVASGKGGVGKSTVAVNLAVTLAKMGKKIGLMDADVYGPSLPLMMNLKGKPMADEQSRIIPLEAYGVKCMSVGFLVADDEPIIWRGPMVMGLIRQFLQQVRWGELDALVIDLPPGTGDAQLTMIQAVDVSGAVIVTTPQQVSVLDAVRGIEMFRKLDVPIIGLVENMSYLDVPGGARMFPFGQGGGLKTARRYEVPLIAQVPLDERIRAGGDTGHPASMTDDERAKPFKAVAEAVAKTLRPLP
ncbi:MAG: Mrp/NBP35 family ATP-binding protein [Myxococcota bacterium]